MKYLLLFITLLTAVSCEKEREFYEWVAESEKPPGEAEKEVSREEVPWKKEAVKEAPGTSLKDFLTMLGFYNPGPRHKESAYLLNYTVFAVLGTSFVAVNQESVRSERYYYKKIMEGIARDSESLIAFYENYKKILFSLISLDTYWDGQMRYYVNILTEAHENIVNKEDHVSHLEDLWNEALDHPQSFSLTSPENFSELLSEAEMVSVITDEFSQVRLWAYSFWVRRWSEGSFNTVYEILKDFKNHYEEEKEAFRMDGYTMSSSAVDVGEILSKKDLHVDHYGVNDALYFRKGRESYIIKDYRVLKEREYRVQELLSLKERKTVLPLNRSTLLFQYKKPRFDSVNSLEMTLFSEEGAIDAGSRSVYRGYSSGSFFSDRAGSEWRIGFKGRNRDHHFVKLYNIDTGSEISTVYHEDLIEHYSVSDDRNYDLLETSDNLILRDFQTGEELLHLNREDYPAALFIPGSASFVILSSDGVLSLKSLDKREGIKDIIVDPTGFICLSVRDDGEELALFRESGVEFYNLSSPLIEFAGYVGYE